MARYIRTFAWLIKTTRINRVPPHHQSSRGNTSEAFLCLATREELVLDQPSHRQQPENWRKQKTQQCSDTGQEASPECELQEKGNRRGEPCDHPSFMPEDALWIVAGKWGKPARAQWSPWRMKHHEKGTEQVLSGCQPHNTELTPNHLCILNTHAHKSSV